MEILKQLLLNLSLLLIILFFFQMWSERNEKPPTKRSYIIYFLLSLLVCFLLTIEIRHDYIIDLRQIPATLAGLYAGWLGSFSLLGSVILIRSLFGIDYGFWVTVIAYTIQAVLTGFFHSWFKKQNTSRRVLLAAGLTFIPLLITLIAQGLRVGRLQLDIWLSFLAIALLGSVIVILTIESIKKHSIMRDNIMKAKKIEVVSHLSASISHEVRNPLCAVRGFLQLIQEPDFPVEKKKEFSQVAMIELDRAEQIITDYLTFAKPTIQQRTEDINLTEALAKVATVVTPLANMNSVDIRKELEGSGFVKGDSTKFFQSIMNIVKNGIEAMPNGGVLLIRAEQTGNRMLITISDTGTGMTKEQLHRLGEPYFSTKGIKGTGLGMMVTYSVIHSMGGHIHVKSEPGSGTVFEISLPRVKGIGDKAV
ncbi:sensor histidine kinase [Bacillus marinisedimentorum]|uniref:sensor histidine kinase n=1 Tax=Bacillus marinisedimentorum TaxID=1821260 RepID=UPI0009F60355|nr:HAMP domain-containing sensor histidine kinase [Bacillus marinisedimentorum]